MRKGRARILAAGGLGIAVLGAVALALWQPWRSRSPADADSARLVGEGRRLYAQYCASCHGQNLEGQANWQQRLANGRLPAPPHDASGHSWHHPDRQLFEITKDGVSAVVPGYASDMPAFRSTLSDDEIWAILAFIKNSWPKEIRARQERLN